MPAPVPIARRPFRGFSRAPLVAGATVEKTFKRAYAAALGNRLTGDWMASGMDADSEIRGAIARLRNRARDLGRNDPYARRFKTQAKINILGHQGVQLATRIRTPTGELDDHAGSAVKAGWKTWGKRGQCSTCRTYSRLGLECLMIDKVIEDGEFFAFRVRGYKNRSGYALRPFEADNVDHEFSVNRLPNGNEVRMGVEINPDTDEIVAYYLWARHPGDLVGASATGGQNRIRVKAKEILHVFLRERPRQTRGVTWFAPVAERMKILDGYQQAAVVGARAAACKMAAVITPAIEGRQYEGDGEDEAGNTISELEPGTIEELPYGKDIKVLDWNNPNPNYGDFCKNVLRGIAAGLNVSYNGLAMDLESVNYSSFRAGKLDENECWKLLQILIAIEQFEEPVFEDWLDEAMLLGPVALPFSRRDEIVDGIHFRGRRWDSVDPGKDAAADAARIAARLTSVRDVIERDGGDIGDVFSEIEEDEALAKEHGFSLVPVPPAGAGAAKPEQNGEKKGGKGGKKADDDEED